LRGGKVTPPEASVIRRSGRKVFVKKNHAYGKKRLKISPGKAE